jgi:CheY-like chemotaxis protein
MERKTVLLAEDDAFLREALEDKLVRSGFMVHTARTGGECVEKALAHHPDLIVLDLLMPHMNGSDALMIIRYDPWGVKAKVIILTNVVDKKLLKENDPQHRVDGYLIKSDTKMGDVLENVQRQLGMPPADEPAQIAAGLPEYRCTCGKLLFKGILQFSTIEIKCKRCGALRRIDTVDAHLLG